jgi:hypothetical protein
MGATWTHKPKGVSIKEFFSREWNGNDFEVIDCAVVHMTTAYIAMKHKPSDTVFAYVAFLMYNPRDYFNFGYRDHAECTIPWKKECPERIMALLTEDFPPHWGEENRKNAIEWRNSCRANLERRAEMPPLSRGMVIKTRELVDFRAYGKYDTFEVHNARRLIFTLPGNGSQKYQIRRRTLRDIGFDVQHKAQEKNLCGKTRPVEEPYEVWRMGKENDASHWEWRILKKYQKPTREAENEYARWFCAVSSPITREQMSSGYELGDVYVSEIKHSAIRVE